MSSPEDRIARAIWGKAEVMYDRRQTASRRSSWRGGRRATDWPEEFASAARSGKRKQRKRGDTTMH